MSDTVEPSGTLSISRRYEAGSQVPTYHAESFPDTIAFSPELIGAENEDGNPLSFALRATVTCENGSATYEYKTGDPADPYGAITMKRISDLAEESTIEHAI